MNYSELLQHILRQYSLYLYNVRILTKVLFQRFFTSPYPDFISASISNVPAVSIEKRSMER